MINLCDGKQFTYKFEYLGSLRRAICNGVFICVERSLDERNNRLFMVGDVFRLNVYVYNKKISIERNLSIRLKYVVIFKVTIIERLRNLYNLHNIEYGVDFYDLFGNMKDMEQILVPQHNKIKINDDCKIFNNNVNNVVVDYNRLKLSPIEHSIISNRLKEIEEHLAILEK